MSSSIQLRSVFECRLLQSVIIRQALARTIGSIIAISLNLAAVRQEVGSCGLMVATLRNGTRVRLQVLSGVELQTKEATTDQGFMSSIGTLAHPWLPQEFSSRDLQLSEGDHKCRRRSLCVSFAPAWPG